MSVPATSASRLRAATDVVAADLDYCSIRLGHELAGMAETRVLLTGGPGFLGYCLVQTIAEWNRRAAPDDSGSPIFPAE